MKRLLTAAALALLTTTAQAGDITELEQGDWTLRDNGLTCEMRLGLPETTGTIQIVFEGARQTNAGDLYKYPPRILVRLQKMDWSFGNPNIRQSVQLGFDDKQLRSGYASINRFDALEIPIATEYTNDFVGDLAEFKTFTVKFVAAPIGYRLSVISWAVPAPGDSKVMATFVKCARKFTGVADNGKGPNCLVRRADGQVFQTSCENAKNPR
jgi:hypothetical protein